MQFEGVTPHTRDIGRIVAWSIFFLIIIYTIITVIGLINLESPQDPVSDPYLSVMEILIIIIAPLITICMVTIYLLVPKELKVYSLIALVFSTIFSTITCIVHFVILTISGTVELSGQEWVSYLLSWRWPSFAYSLDILAWDVFFAITMLFTAKVFKGERLSRLIRILLIISGILSLLGLIGVPLENMQIRMIGVIGYAVVSPFAFLLIGIFFHRSKVS